jgi:hypothetical protein
MSNTEHQDILIPIIVVELERKDLF